MSRLERRRWINRLVLGASMLAASVGIVMLAWILFDVLRHGLGAIDLRFFTELPPPPGEEGGGMANAIVGTLKMTAAAALIATPVGLVIGIYLSEFGRSSRFGELVRRLLDVMVAAPSIVIGVVVYLVLVRPVGHFSGWAGAVALAIIMLPVVARTSEDMLRLVPNEQREAALALGAPYWRMTLSVLLRAARAGIATGALLAVARIAGETAPLVFTALNSPYWNESLAEPTANMTVTLFNYAMSPYERWHELAWGAALVITLGVLLVTIATRIILHRGGRS